MGTIKLHACVLNKVSCQGVFMVPSNYPILKNSFVFHHFFLLQRNVCPTFFFSRLFFFFGFGFYNFTVLCKMLQLICFFQIQCVLICQIYCDLFILSDSSLNKSRKLCFQRVSFMSEPAEIANHISWCSSILSSTGQVQSLFITEFHRILPSHWRLNIINSTHL